MRKTDRFSFYLIGEDSLSIDCAKILLSHQWICQGIVSPLLAIKEWANENNIPYFRTVEEAKSSLYKEEFDFLFSIVNSYIISNELLKLPRFLSINYHSALLPQYAGLYPSSWAILNNEKIHGVTWHIMSTQIDGGNILKQGKIEIEHNETAFSLSLKCYQQGLVLFKELIDELENSIFDSLPQDLSKRSYHGLDQKPPGNGWINWNYSAEEIDRLCRALNLGHYINQFSLPKFKILDEIFILEKHSILKEKSKFLPGTLVRLDSDKWQISTQTYDLLVHEIRTIEGKTYSLPHIVHYYNLKLGDKLYSPTDEDLKKFEQLSADLTKHESFWVNQLYQFKTATLPYVVHSIPASENTEHVCAQVLNLPSPLCQDLKQIFSKIELPQTILTAWLVYLYRLGNKEHLGIFLNHPKIEETTKDFSMFFSNELPFTIDFNENISFIEALEQVKTHYSLLNKKVTYLKDIQHRYPEITHNMPTAHIKALITDKNISSLTRRLNSDIIMTISTDGTKINWIINKILLEKQYVKAIIDNIPHHFLELLEGIRRNKTQKIAQIPLLTSQEKQKILIDWNKTTTSYPFTKTISQVFEELVKKNPDNLAVIHKNDTLTYKELNEKSNKLARFLLKQGLRTDVLVGISADHDLWLIISMLAVLKAGATYLPIDPYSQVEHIKTILEDCNPEIILTQNIHKKIIKKAASKKTKIIIFKKDFLLESESGENIICKKTGENPAYVIYTSGTTGKPKGVIISHKSVIRLVKNTNYIKIQPTDRVAQSANTSFDAATFEIWGALLNSACLVEVSKNSLLSPIKFNHFLKAKKITILWLTSPLFNEYVSYKPQMFKDLNYLLVGGDIVNLEKIKQVLNCKKGVPKYILNGYGPTENTTFTTVHLIDKNDLLLDSIPVGKPISNTFVYVLDEYLQPVPIGAPGELYAGGDGIALGYLNNVQLTNEKFVIDPFNNNTQSRLYKTGDIVRWTPDGTLDYLGRKDKQVKIRGYRVELEGIEQYILQNKNILQCVVIAKRCINQENHLIAYIVKKNSSDANLTVELKKELSRQLPDYMIPRYFININRIPLTSNGKVDYKKLPEPDKIESHTLYVPPRNEIEKKLCIIWSTLFSVKKISVLDDFFNMGGHSLLLTRLILEIKRTFEFDLNIHDFLKFPTIAYLARIIYNETDLKIDDLGIKIISDDIKWNDYTVPKNSLSSGSKNNNALLLTGCTGFLGAHLLYSLHNEYDGDIYCLIRSNSVEDGFERLKSALNKYHLKLNLKNRIKPVPCDISQPFLGLSTDLFSTLASKVSTIYHNAAHVNHIYSYHTLRSENVLSTIEIIKFATLKRRKKIHYISTLSAVLECTDENNVVIEDFIHKSGDTCHLLDGYNQTKWASEKILSRAHERGMPVKIYRPGWILGDSHTGAVSADKNHLLLLIKGCIQMRTAPDWEMDLNILPVNFLSESIAKISLENSDIGSDVFNFVNTHTITWKDFISYLNSVGYPILIMKASKWKQEYLTKIDESNALFNLLPLHMNPQVEWIQNLSAICRVCDNNTQAALNKLNLVYPEINNDLLNKYISFLRETKFI